MMSRSGTVDQTVEPAHRAEVRAKLAQFVRAPLAVAARSAAPQLTNLLLDAFDAMEAAPQGGPLLPNYQPLDLFVTVTDFRGYPEALRLNSPPEVIEREHRIILSFQDPGGRRPQLRRSRSSSPSPRARPRAFRAPSRPSRSAELDKCLEQRARPWPGRAVFLDRALPRQATLGDADNAVLIDGSVLANAPFGPCIDALEKRPARREIDRRFVYIDPKPGLKSVRLTGGDESEAPGFFATIFGALSDIPREQPIRDNLEAIERLSARIRRLRRIVDADPARGRGGDRARGRLDLLPDPADAQAACRLARAQRNELAARSAGYAYAAYAHLKIGAVVEDAAESIFRLGGGGDRIQREDVRQALWAHVRARGLTDEDAVSANGARPDVILFLRDFDKGFRTRRLRFVARRSAQLVENREDAERVRGLLTTCSMPSIIAASPKSPPSRSAASLPTSGRIRPRP